MPLVGVERPGILAASSGATPGGDATKVSVQGIAGMA